MKTCYKSYAKINLTLDVTDQKKDFLSITTIMQSISLCDLIDIEISPGSGVNVSYKNCSLKPEVPPTYQAVIDFCQIHRIRQQIDIIIHKTIPIKSGLGGGSSNLVTIICALNQLCRCGVSRSELIKFCHQYSKDAPFFFYGGTALVTQPDAFVRELPDIMTDASIVLAYTAPGLSTPLVCQRYREQDHAETHFTEKMLQQYSAAHCANAFLPTATKMMPSLTKLSSQAHLSGTGSTLYRIHQSIDAAEQTLTEWQQKQLQCFLVKPIKPKTPIKNFFLTGQDIVTAGVGGAMFSGVLTASAMQGKNLIKKIYKN